MERNCKKSENKPTQIDYTRLVEKSAELLKVLASNEQALKDLPIVVKIEIGEKYADLREELEIIANTAMK